MDEKQVMAVLTPENLKSYLRRHRRKHYQRGADACPLGYLLRETFPGSIALVFPDRLVLFTGSGRALTLAVPRWVTEYVIRFDRETERTGAVALRELNALVAEIEDEEPVPAGEARRLKAPLKIAANSAAG